MKDKKKITVKLSPKTEDFENLLNCILQSGFDFWTDNQCNTVRLFFKDESGFNLVLNINGSWSIE